MKVVLVGPFGLHPKGTMRARALPAARALAERGHGVTVVMPPWHTPDEGGRSWREPVSGVQVEYVSLGGLSVPAAGHVAVAGRLAAAALARRPDVVHVFKPKGYSGLAATMLRLRQRRRSGFVLAMDTDDWEGRGGWNDLEPYNCWQRWLFPRQEVWGLRHADVVTVASRALETLVWALGVAPHRVIYLPNALRRDPTAVAAPGGTRPDGESPTLLLYTRFFEFDLQRPLDVLRVVRRDHPEARLLVVGRGLHGEERRFLDMAGAMGLEGAVRHRGWVEGAELAAALSAADVALYPFDDNLVNRAKSSVKLLELMAAGVPVVAEAVGQNREVIEDGRSGFLVASGDVRAFARAVTALASDPALRQAVGEAGRRRIATAFDWAHLGGRLEAAYAAGVDRRRARQSRS